MGLFLCQVHHAETRKYRINAGQCDKCGYFKSWDFKIMNPKSGKHVPGHVTKEGFKINDGDCPFYALLKIRSESKAQDPAHEQEPAPAPQVQPTKLAPAIKKATERPLLSFSREGDTIIATIGACSASLSRRDALKACQDMLAMLGE